MRTLSIAYRQAIRLRMLLDMQSGKRKDSRVRICRDLKRRLGISQADFDLYVKDMGNGGVMLNLKAIDAQPGLTLELRSEEEHRVLTELIDSIEWSVGDLDSWVDDLVRELEKEPAAV